MWIKTISIKKQTYLYGNRLYKNRVIENLLNKKKYYNMEKRINNYRKQIKKIICNNNLSENAAEIINRMYEYIIS